LWSKDIPILFNHKKPADYLLTHGLVFTLRKKRRLDKELTVALMGSVIRLEVLGRVKIQWVRTIDREDLLRPYLTHSGFNSIDEWVEQTEKDGKELYRVDLYLN